MPRNTLKEGQKLSNLLVSTTGGTLHYLSSFRGKKVLVYCWASWSTSRDHLSDLQKFYEKHRSPNFDMVSIALDVQGPEPPMRYLTKNRVTFMMMIDAYSILSRAWGIKKIPQAVLLDETGRVMIAAEQVDYAFLSEVEKRLSLKPAAARSDDPPLEHGKDRHEILMQNATNLLGRGENEEAVRILQEALKLAPDNDIIRTQILVLQHPEKFYQGAIDTAWVTGEIGKVT